MATKNRGALVRASRDGDRFHYTWAARRSLQILRAESGLVALSIEGPSNNNTRGLEDEEVIDVGEYYGTEDLDTCQGINYIQLKHSTLRDDRAWMLSELRDTLARFGAIFKSHADTVGLAVAESKVRFTIVSNRPFGPSILRAMNGAGHRMTSESLKATGLDGSLRDAIERKLVFAGGERNYLGQGELLRQDLDGYLTEDDADAPLRLRELVTQKALSHNADRNVIRRSDLLGALQISPDELLPSPNRIESQGTYARHQENELTKRIVNHRAPCVIHAAGGVGKSVLATRLPALLPSGSVSVVFDCFGNGSYRQPGRARHTVQRSLPQIVNELAAQGLCDLLIPSSRALPDRYYRTFEHRLNQCSHSLAERSTDAIVCIIVDAADNSEMAADEAQESPSFIRQLLRMPLPPNVRLVALSRTERLHLLHLPSEVEKLQLQNFTEIESAVHLRKVFPHADDMSVREFHRLTSANPRVQAAVLAEGGSLASMLSSLGGTPRSADDSIAASLERTMGRLLDNAPTVERAQIDRLLEAIATLRPFVPLEVLAAVANVSPALVESFTADFGRPLLLLNNSLQFRDEPTETWFRERFRPKEALLTEFVGILEHLAETHAYAAATLPQLLLETNQTDRLLSLALTGTALPQTPAERRSIEVQRLLFALKAAIRENKFVAATKLAFRAAQEVSGAGRQSELLAANLDLVVSLWPAHQALELTGTETFKGEWLGTRHVCYGALYARFPGSEGEASSQLRIAEDWLRVWSNQSKRMDRIDIPTVLKAELAEIHWRLFGEEDCISWIKRWYVTETRFAIARLLAKRALELGRGTALKLLLAAANGALEIELALLVELNNDQETVAETVLSDVLCRLKTERVELSGNSWDSLQKEIEATVVAFVEVGLRSGLSDHSGMAEILDPFLAGLKIYDFSWTNRQRRSSLIRAFVLQRKLRNLPRDAQHFAPKELRGDPESPRSSDNQSREEFNTSVSTLLPWHVLCVDQLFDPQAEAVVTAISDLRQKSLDPHQIYSRRHLHLADDIGVMWAELLASRPQRDEEAVSALLKWANGEDGIQFIPTWIRMTRIAHRSASLRQDAYVFAQRAAALADGATLDASSRADSYVELSRSLLRFDKHEAAHYFNAAVVTVSKLGDEAHARWLSVLDVAEAAAGVVERGAELAYRVGRCAEFVEDYDSKHFDWDSTIRVLNGLSPSSAIAIVSRWHDRRFGWSEETLSTLVEDLRSRRLVGPRWVVPFFWFKASWSYVALIEQLLTETEPEGRASVFETAIRPLILEPRGANLWRELLSLAKRFGLPVAQVEGRLAIEEDYEKGSPRTQTSSSSSEEQRKVSRRADRRWRALGVTERLYTAAQLMEAHEAWLRLSKAGTYLPTELFIERIFRYSKPERAVDMISAFSGSTSFYTWDQVQFFEAIPTVWKQRVSVLRAIQDAAVVVARRSCLCPSRPRYGQGDLFGILSSSSGLQKGRLSQEALRTASELPAVDDAESLFNLISHLANCLSPAEAAEVLDVGLNLLEEQIPEEHADGPWHEGLKPVGGINASLATYLYCQLASPKATLRWQAAHAVVELGLSGDHDQILMRLVALDSAGSFELFTDRSLPFYQLHARLWLLQALVRIAKEQPQLLLLHERYFETIALNEDHVLLRELAAEILQHLLSLRMPQDAKLLARLAEVNRSPFPPATSRSGVEEHQSESESEQRTGEVKFIFGYDFERYWMEPLDRVFGLRKGSASRACQTVIRNKWAGQYTGRWKDDPRAERKIFRDRENWHSHGNHPATDDLNTYITFHAQMMTTGVLLRTSPVQMDQIYGDDAFERWLNDNRLTQKKAPWIAEGRDPEPSDLIQDDQPTDDRAWRWCIQRRDFAQCIAGEDGRLVLDGRWKTVRGRRIERISVASRLVSKTTAEALKRALQNGDPYRHSFPDREEEFTASSPLFQLESWLDRTTHERDLEQFDPWAGSVRRETLAPTDIVRRAIDGTLQSNDRKWILARRDGELAVLWSENWGSVVKNEQDDTPIPNGVRVQVSPDFLERLLRESSLSLIVKITIEREIHRHSYEKTDEDPYAYIPPYCLYHVLDTLTEAESI